MGPLLSRHIYITSFSKAIEVLIWTFLLLYVVPVCQLFVRSDLSMVQANGIEDAHSLQEGQELWIPRTYQIKKVRIAKF